MKKVLCLATVSILCVLMLFSGCKTNGSGNGSGSSQKVKITFLSWGAGGQAISEKSAVANFNKANPNIGVDIQFVPDMNAFNTKVNTLVAAGTPPDVSYTQEFLANEWGAKGELQDLTQYMSNDPNMNVSAFIPGTIFQSKGSIWGIGLGPENMYMYINKDVFNAAHVALPSADPENPWTWDQMLAAAKALTVDQNGKHPGQPGFDKTKIKTYGINIDQSYLTEDVIMASNDGGFVSPDGKTLEVTSAASEQVLQAMCDLSNKYFVAPTPAYSQTMPGMTTALENGQLAMYVTGQWCSSTFNYDKFPVGSSKIDIAPIPVFKHPANITWSAAIVIYKNSKHKDQSWDFVKYMCTPDSNLNMFADGTWIPPLKSWYTDSTEIQKWTGNAAHGGNFVNVVIPTATKIAIESPALTIKNWNQIVSIGLTADLDPAFSGKVSVQQALANVNSKYQSYLTGSWN